MVDNNFRARYFINSIAPLLVITLLCILANCNSTPEKEDAVFFKDSQSMGNDWSAAFGEHTVLDFKFKNEDTELFSVGSILTGKNGDYFILDGKQQKIFQFNSELEFVRCIGGHGEGPGEILIYSAPIIDKQNNILVFDRGKRRMNKYDFPDYIYSGEISFHLGVQDTLLDDSNNFIFYSISEKNVLFKFDRKGEYIKRTFIPDHLRLRLFMARFQLGRMSDVDNNGFIFIYPEDYKIIHFNYDLSIRGIFKNETPTRFFPEADELPGHLSPYSFTPKHSKWWSEKLRPAFLFYLGNRFYTVILFEYKNLSEKLYLNIHDLDGITYAAGLEVPFEGIVRYAKDGYIYVVENSRFDEKGGVTPLKIHRFKLILEKENR